MSEFVGINVRAKDEYQNNWEKMRRFESVREYHDWSIDVGFPSTTHRAFDCHFANTEAIRFFPGSYYYPPGYIPPVPNEPGEGDIEPALMTEPSLYLDHAKWNTAMAIKYGNGTTSPDLATY